MPPKRPTQPNDALRRARILRGWSQEQVAEQVGTSGFTVSRWELGQAFPRPYYRQKLAEVFAQSPEALGLLPPTAGTTPESPAGHPHFPPLLPHRPTLTRSVVGRSDLLTRLKRRLMTGPYRALYALDGLPGVGKTTLALELASDAAVQAFFADGILWAAVGRSPSLLEVLSRWGAGLGIPPAEASQLTTIPAWAQALRGAIGQRRVLLILDDVWALEDALACQVGGSQAVHLLTTRSPELALHFAGEGRLSITELAEDAGLELLGQLAPHIVAAEPEAAKHLVRAVGGLPLGLVLLGKYLHTQSASGQPQRIRDALERLQSSSDRLHIRNPYVPATPHSGVPPGTPLSLEASIHLSVSALAASAQAMLGALALLPPKPASFAEEAALAVADDSAQTLDLLVDAGLVERLGAGRYRLHQTIADYAHQHAPQPAAEERLVHYCLRSLQDYPRDYEAWEQESSTILAALELTFVRQWQDALVQCILAWWPFLEARGWYLQAEPHLVRAEHAARSLREWTNLGTILLMRGQLEQQRSHYSQAATCFEEALRLARKQHQATQMSDALVALGNMAHQQGHYAEAEAFLQEALGLLPALEPREQTAALLDALGTLALKRGDHPQAERYLEEGLVVARQFDDPEHISLLLQRLGVLATQQGNLTQAATFLQEALSIARHLGHRARLCSLLTNLGTVLQGRGEYVQAEASYQEALGLARQLDRHDWLPALFINLGELASDQDHFEQAQAYFEEGLILAKDNGNPVFLGVLNANLAKIFRKGGKKAQAQVCLQEALAIARQLGNAGLLMLALDEWGGFHLQQGQLELATAAFEEALHLAERAGSEEWRATALYGLAQTSAARDDVGQAIQLGQDSVRSFEASNAAKAQEVKQWLAHLSLPTQGQTSIEE